MFRRSGAIADQSLVARQFRILTGFDLLHRQIDRAGDVPLAIIFGRAYVNNDGLIGRQQPLQLLRDDARHVVLIFMSAMIVRRWGIRLLRRRRTHRNWWWSAGCAGGAQAGAQRQKGPKAPNDGLLAQIFFASQCCFLSNHMGLKFRLQAVGVDETGHLKAGLQTICSMAIIVAAASPFD